MASRHISNFHFKDLTYTSKVTKFNDNPVKEDFVDCLSALEISYLACKTVAYLFVFLTYSTKLFEEIIGCTAFSK